MEIQYVTNDKGEKIRVVISFHEWNKLK